MGPRLITFRRIGGLIYGRFDTLVVDAGNRINGLFVRQVTFVNRHFRGFAQQYFGIRRQTFFVALHTYGLLFSNHFGVGSGTADKGAIAHFAKFRETTTDDRRGALFLNRLVSSLFFTVTRTFFTFWVRGPTRVDSNSFLGLLVKVMGFRVRLLDWLTPGDTFSNAREPGRGSVTFLYRFFNAAGAVHW